MAFCSKCGKEIMEGCKFCHHCGEKMVHTPLTQLPAQICDDEFIAFIGNNAPKYLLKFKKFNIEGIDNFAATWHWPAFIVGSLWMLYRKLYLWALIAFILSLIPYINIAAWMAFGITGNYIYYKHAKKKIFEVKAAQPSSGISTTLSQIGGVNKWVASIAIIIITSVIGFLAIFVAFVIMT